MTLNSELKPPAAQLFDLLNEQTPVDACDFWRFASAAAAEFVPPGVTERPRYFSDARVVVLAMYCTKYDMPCDAEVSRQVDVALARVEACSVKYWH